MTSSMPGLGAVAALHARLVEVRNRRYDSGKARTHRLPRPVISVGNLTVGGTGKTPFVEDVARLLSDEGYFVCILSRGYMGANSDGPALVSDLLRVLQGPAVAGDEPFLLATKLPGVPVVVGADRHAAGLFALERVPVHLFLLDDGFQHRRLQRDVDIVLLDASSPWGGGALLPAGRLREPASALRRAHAIGLTRLHQADPAMLQQLKADLAREAPGVPVFGTRAQITGVRRIPHGSWESLDRLAGVRVLAFAGIARPDAFFRDAEALGAIVVKRREFPDHHAYSTAEVRELLEQAVDAGASALLTTEKDAVRLPAPPRRHLPVLALRQRVVAETPDSLLRFIQSKLPGPSRGGQSL